MGLQSEDKGFMQAMLDTSAQGQIVGPESEFQRKRLALRSQFGEAVDAAKLITEITSQEQAQAAVDVGRTLQVGVKETEACFKAVKVRIDDIKKPILAQEKEDIARLTVEKDRLGKLQTTWDAKVRREKEEADRIAREAAEKQAREEQLARAVELEQAGDLQQAEAVLEEPVYAAPVFTQAAAPTAIAGKVSKVNYGMEVVDFMALVRAVAAGQAPQQALQANESFLNAQAKAFKEGFHIVGCKLTKEETTHYRS